MPTARPEALPLVISPVLPATRPSERAAALSEVSLFVQALLRAYPTRRGHDPRLNTRAALNLLEAADSQRRFWGANQMYTRKHSAESAFIASYYDEAVASLGAE